ncbi:hypothetical protein AZI86_06265 [Bdellovibrio bacteriovorus]|uniref:Protein glutaminase domain-containing protein n=1 Tax=Bdellovibrio bacteriovorus TaxID=959 RepID=A0A150WQK0_BDEBC|nr:protein-glutamine glutaminase family protein [Bdellovibrio bacteriovorus]KYG66646.1 hypothetical protein AZI86_06265 [Bdellovibrio bacteriovorus]
MRLLSILVLTGFTLSISAFAQGLSAVRETGETYEQAQARSLMLYQLKNIESFTQPDTYLRRTPMDVKVSLEKLDTTTIPQLSSYEVLENEFKYIRDTRFFNSPDPKFPRRLTWLYPDDGCYARAEMAKIKLVEHKQIAPNKIFVFGNLNASTKNTFNGRVQWWYHVAATYRVDTKVYVFDPSIEPEHPLTLDEWHLAVGGAQTSVKYAVCAPNAFDPNSNCERPVQTNISDVISEQTDFLGPEWERVELLHRDPTKELGEFPPWLH